jgi:hypothetical protein
MGPVLPYGSPRDGPTRGTQHKPKQVIHNVSTSTSVFLPLLCYRLPLEGETGQVKVSTDLLAQTAGRQISGSLPA